MYLIKDTSFHFLLIFLINEHYPEVCMYSSSALLYHQNICIYPKKACISAMFSIAL